ncbi:MAG: hypothetical protein ACRDHF_09495, partial [Tepidiformaceae bacterium]
PMAVVIPAGRYAAMERDWEEFWAMVHRIQERNADVPPEEIYAEVEEAIREIRKGGRRKPRQSA